MIWTFGQIFIQSKGEALLNQVYITWDCKPLPHFVPAAWVKYSLACVAGARKNGRARERHAREFLSPRMSPPRAPVLSCVHYFQEPATQARYSLGTDERASILQEPTPEFGYSDADRVHQDLVVRHSSGHPRSPCQTFCAAVEPR